MGGLDVSPKAMPFTQAEMHQLNQLSLEVVIFDMALEFNLYEYIYIYIRIYIYISLIQYIYIYIHREYQFIHDIWQWIPAFLYVSRLDNPCRRLLSDGINGWSPPYPIPVRLEDKSANWASPRAQRRRHSVRCCPQSKSKRCQRVAAFLDVLGGYCMYIQYMYIIIYIIIYIYTYKYISWYLAVFSYI